MKIAWVTGAHGFVGRNLSLELARRQYVVGGVGHGVWPDEEASRYGLAHWLNGEISANNLEALRSRGGVPDVIYHLAGGSSVGASLSSPHEDFERTVSTTARLLEWVRQHSKATKVVAVSSAAVYGDGHSAAIPEDARLNPYSPYGLHKRFMEDMCLQYARDFGLSCAIVRLFSVYGAGLRKQLLWDACSRLQRGETRLAFGGTGEETRDWTHVGHAVRMIASAADHDRDMPFVVNAATGVATSVREVLESVVAAWGSGAILTFSGQRRAGDPFHLVADVGRIAPWNVLPQRTLASGLSEYVEWFKGRRLTP